MHTKEEKMRAFGRFLDVLDALRANCPWDKKQTNESLRPNTIEETYELCDALIKNDIHDICKELGDVLLHICFYAKIAEEKGQFDMADVCDALTRKMITRHPHVYHPSQIEAEDPKPLPFVPTEENSPRNQGIKELDSEEKNPIFQDSLDNQNLSVGQVLQNWEQLKLKEKGGNKRVLAGVPDALPSTIKAFRIPEKAAHVGFDWDTPEGALDKVKEEYAELKQEISAHDKEKAEQELGDLLFSIINVARLYKIHPDDALERTNKKFIRRFNYVEEAALSNKRQLKDMTLEEMDALWNEAKSKGL